jgi:hypothetical protein
MAASLHRSCAWRARAHPEHRSAVVMSYLDQLVRERCPKAFASDRIYGSGPYALLSCLDGVSRHVFLFPTTRKRYAVLNHWEGGKRGRCCAQRCTDDHVLLDFQTSSAVLVNVQEEVPAHA